MAPNGRMKKPKDAHIWPRDPHDWYVEPEWCSAALFEREPFSGTCRDPSAGQGNVILPARAAGLKIEAHDLFQRGLVVKITIRDFLNDPIREVDNLIGNPPFKHCKADDGFPWIVRALKTARRKVALLLPLGWAGAITTQRWLEGTPLRRVYFLAPRPAMPPGSFLAAGNKANSGRVDFAWFIWDHNFGSGQGDYEMCFLQKPAHYNRSIKRDRLKA